jgi:ACS family tartrate transporter-like MFS transporter
VGLYTFAFWLPQIIKSIGDLSIVQTGLITMIPYLVAGSVMYLWGRYSDHNRAARQWHIALPAVLGAMGLGLSALPHLPPVVSMAALTLAASGLYASLPPFWTLPPRMLTGAAAAAGIALINALGNIGGFLGPSLLGIIKAATGSYAPSLISLAALLLAAAVLAKLIKIEDRVNS